ncbi:MAG: IclR family transcriptional regulator [Armatimonadota bacterium]|nr:IclR family transcriptional regulator [Armatimonadota bacterium]MDR7445394.1 IclR family transcriptional regulator [Armatimonadota bacterium]MDR7569719.1 IclR family transcriptional regulator [Armatimonadota bacterium]MDR7614127.1 IclR family transcriptional regulator [Armatimonadota bacterium]
MKIRSRTRTGVQSVERAAALLRVLGEAGQPLTPAEISARIGVPRPTVYRLLGSLAREGLVTPMGRGFTIGAAVLWLAARRLEQLELRTVGRPILQELRDRTGETVHLAVLEGGQVVYVEKVESPGPIRMASMVGRIFPAHSTALGKAMLAHLPSEQVEEIIRRHGLPQRTPNTITDPKQLFEELSLIRARGFSIDNVENEEGIRCVGAPIFDHTGAVAGAVSVSGSVATISLERARRELGPLVREAAERISRELGWTGTLLPNPP